MGHANLTVDDIDPTLTAPLEGYLEELKESPVPKWVKKPRTNSAHTRELLGLDMGTNRGIPRQQLPSGVSRVAPHSPTKYEWERDEYLEANREHAIKLQQDRPIKASFDLNTERSRGVTHLGSLPGTPVPEPIRNRLALITETPQWGRQVDGFHQQFRGWKLAYHINRRGEIEDIEICADIHL